MDRGALTYLGCYCDLDCPDKAGQRDLPTLISSNISPLDCFEKAKEQGFQYAGLQGGQQCFAGTNPPTEPELLEADCNYECKFDSAMKCGGDARNSVWNLSGGTAFV